MPNATSICDSYLLSVSERFSMVTEVKGDLHAQSVVILVAQTVTEGYVEYFELPMLAGRLYGREVFGLKGSS